MESTNSGLKRRQSLGELRVRGMKAVAHALYVRLAGWNLLQATRSVGLRAKIRAILAQRGLLGRIFARWFGWNRQTVTQWPTTPTRSPALKLGSCC